MTMDQRLVIIGRTLFAIGLAGFGVLQFIYGDFVAGRAPAYPDALAGRLPWAFVTGAGFIAAAAAIVTGKQGRWAALAVGALIFVWALLRNMPMVVDADAWSGAWTQMGKSLVLFGGSWAIAASLPPVHGSGKLASAANRSAELLYLGRICLGLFMILCGIQHFIHDQFVATLVPTWIPGAYFWTYACGVALVAGGIGLLISSVAPLAAALTSLMIFLWVITLHIPRAMSPLYDGRNEWTSVFEATALSGLAVVLWRVLPERDRAPEATVSHVA